ncbi:MAG: MFS transporter [Deltaproteobacteria bacterium]|nr:MFS transporter [Deltaproteobacteria bacterium]
MVQRETIVPVEAQQSSGTAPATGVRLGTLLAYAPPIVGLSAPLFMVQFYFLNFATDVLLLSPFVVAVLFATGRVWDAISDPIVGTLSDRTRTRLGRRRPWMLAGILPLMLSLLMIWSPPDLSAGMLYVWLTLALFTFYTAFTMFSVPHSALGAELTTDHYDRNRIFGAQGASFTLGMMMAFGGMQYVTNANAPREAAGQLVWIAVFVLPMILLIPPTQLRERVEYQGRGATTSMGAMRDVLKNPHARLLLTAQFIQLMGSGVLGIMAPYLMRYVLKRPDLIGVLPAMFVLCSISSIPIWVRLSRRFGKRNVWVTGMIGSGLSFGSILFIGEGDYVMMGAVLCSAGLFVGCGMMVGNSILADVIDWDELETGERKEGAYSAAWGFAIKTATAIVIVAVGAALSLSDYEANQQQTEGTLLMFRLINGGAPLVMYLLGAFLFRRFELNETEHAAIRAELDRRAAGR